MRQSQESVCPRPLTHILVLVMPPATARQSHDSRQVIDSARAAWEELAAHLRTEAAWREDREVEAISRYVHSEPMDISGDLPLGAVQATLLASGGREDVFEHAEAMIGLCRQTLDALLSQIDLQEPDSQPREEHRRDGDCVVGVKLDIVAQGLWQMLEESRARWNGEEERAPDDSQASSGRHSEMIGAQALARVMVGFNIQQRDASPEGTHDLDLIDADSGEVRAKVEITELTNEAGRKFTNDISEKPKRVSESGKRLRFEWYVSMTLNDPPYEDNKEAKGKWKKANGELVSFLEWVESQMSTVEGVQNLARLRSQSPHKNPVTTGARPHFNEVKESSGHGGLFVKYGGTLTKWLSDGNQEPSPAAALINSRISSKAKLNQAKGTSEQPDAAPTPKWLILYLDSYLSKEVPFEIESRRGSPASWAAFAEQIELQHFDEVWVVWDAPGTPDHPPHVPDTIYVAAFTPMDSRYFATTPRNGRDGLDSDSDEDIPRR